MGCEASCALTGSRLPASCFEAHIVRHLGIEHSLATKARVLPLLGLKMMMGPSKGSSAAGMEKVAVSAGGGCFSYHSYCQ